MRTSWPNRHGEAQTIAPSRKIGRWPSWPTNAAASRAPANSESTRNCTARSVPKQQPQSRASASKQDSESGKELSAEEARGTGPTGAGNGLSHCAAEQEEDCGKALRSRIWWTKALALTAITGILAFVLGEQFSAQRPGQVEANGAGGSALTQNGSGPGYSARRAAPRRSTRPTHT